jgi:hypothetical protein
MFSALYFLFFFLLPLTRYASGQIFNPSRLIFELVLGLFFFLFVWKAPTVSQSIFWAILLVAIYSGGFLAEYVTSTVFHESLSAIDIVAAIVYGLALSMSGFALVRPASTKVSIRLVFITSSLSWAATVLSYVSFYGPAVGFGRATVAGITGPFVAIVGTVIRVRGDWESRERKNHWEYSKSLDSEDWTGSDAEIIETEVDSFSREKREVKIHICRFETGGDCEDRVLTVSKSLGELVWDEIDDFSGSKAHILVKEGSIVGISFWGIPMKEDPAVISVVNKLCAELDLHDIEANWLFWEKNKVPVSIWRHLPGPPYRLSLDESLAGKLDPLEWKPLIASILIFERKLWRWRLLRQLPFLLGLMVTFLVEVVVIDLFRRFLGPLIETYLLVTAVACSLAIIGTIRLKKRKQLEADVLAARIDGKSSLLGALNKVRGLAPATRRRSKMDKLLSIFASRPTTTERIDLLKRPR